MKTKLKRIFLLLFFIILILTLAIAIEQNQSTNKKIGSNTIQTIDQSVDFGTNKDSLFFWNENSNTTVQFIGLDILGQNMPIESILGFDINVNETTERIKFAYELNLPHIQFNASILINSTQVITLSNKDIIIRNLNLSFQDVL